MWVIWAFHLEALHFVLLIIFEEGASLLVCPFNTIMPYKICLASMCERIMCDCAVQSGEYPHFDSESFFCWASKRHKEEATTLEANEGSSM